MEVKLRGNRSLSLMQETIAGQLLGAARRGDLEDFTDLLGAWRRALPGVHISEIASSDDDSGLLHAAIEGENARLVRLCVERGISADYELPGNNDGSRPVHFAVLRKTAEPLRALLALGADPNAEVMETVGPTTALLMAINMAGPEVPVADHVAALVAAGADVNRADGSGMTALMWALEGGYAEVAAVLLAAGADPTAGDRRGENALDLFDRKLEEGAAEADDLKPLIPLMRFP